jgi:hypothetical protein
MSIPDEEFDVLGEEELALLSRRFERLHESRRSTMEAELTALDTAIVEAEWLRELLMDLPVVENPIPTISMNCDNQTVIVKVNSSKDNMKSTRNVKRQLKCVRKLRNSGVIALDYVNTSKKLADQFTKGLSCNVIEGASRELGLRPTVTP